MKFEPYTKVSTDDPRIAALCHRFPEITHNAAIEIALALGYAEDKGRAYAAEQLIEEFAAAKAAGADERSKVLNQYVQSARLMMDACRDLSRAYELFVEESGKAKP